MDNVTIALLLGLVLVAFQAWRKLQNRAPATGEVWDDVSFGNRAHALFEAMPVGFHALDGDGVIRQVNPQEVEIRGKAAGSLVGRPFWELVPEAEQDEARFEFFRKLETETAERGVRRLYRRADGTVLTLEVSESLIRNDSGHVVGLAVTSIDISDHCRNEEQVYQTTSELKAVFDAFPDHFLRLDDQGLIVDQTLGRPDSSSWTEQEIVGRSLADVVPQQVREKLTQCFGEVKRTNEIRVLEFRKSGAEDEFYEIRLLPLTWSETIAVVRNVTDQRRNEKRLAQTAQELEEKNRELEVALLKAQEATKLKSRFLANMSHEIRTPMNGVIGMTDFLAATSLDEEQSEYVDSIKSSANSLMTVLNDILDISKIEAGKLQIESIPFRLEAVLDEIATVFSLRARGKGLTFLSVPPPSMDSLVVGDPGRIRQVLNNLLSNAIKFTQEGSVTLRAEVSEQSGDRVGIRFSVEDTGIGIPPEQQSKLFTNFVQADDSMTRKYGGTGLGLAISKQLVELMKGRIGFESTEGKGSKFWFTAEFGRRAADSDEQPVPDLSGLRVLVVDRKKSSLSPLHRHLPNWGCKTEVVDHGSLVVPTLKKAAAARPFRIALIDLELAAQDGLSVESSIKMDPEIGRTSLIAVTSSPMRGDGLKVHRAGYSGYLAKPFEPEDLRGVIAEVLRNENRLEPPLATRHTVAEQRSRPRTQDKKKHAKPVETPRTVKQPVEAQQSVLPKPRAKATSKAAADNGSKSKALIAEDNLVNQKIAARLLQRVGLDVDVVSNGLEAVKACETTAYDLILMDCQMPEMDGFEATERIRRLENNGRRTPICALTAHAMKSDREKCLASGMDDYLTKPVDAKKLGDMVKKLIPQEAGKAAGASR